MLAALLFWLTGIYSATAQPFRELPPELDGTMMPIDLSRCDTVPVWGDTLKPCGAVYVSRHGARFLSSENKVRKLEKTLSEARASGTLTPKGERMMSLLDSVRRHTDGQWGALSDIGKQEQRILARQMHALAPMLMDTARIYARATYVPRVVMTMYEYCHTIAWLSSRVEVSTAEGHRFDSLLRFFKTDRGYAEYISDGAWKSVYQDFASHNVPTAPAVSLVGTGPGDEKLREITMDMYGVLQGMRAVGLPAPTDYWMSEADYRRCWETANLDHYLLRSANAVSDLAPRSARVLLRAMLSSLGSQAAAGGEMDFFFGHAETVMPLFALMRLPGCFCPELPMREVAERWKDYEVSPLGADLAIFLLRSESGRLYVAMRLNGKFIPMPGSIRKVTDWLEFKTFYGKMAAD